MDALQAQREKLEEQWKTKQCWLESVHLEQVFYRDADSIDKTSSSQEVRLIKSLCKEMRKLQRQCLNFCCASSSDPAEQRHTGRHGGRDGGSDQTT